MMNNIKFFASAKTLFIIAVFTLLLPVEQLSAQARRPTTGTRPATTKPATTKPAAAKPAAAKPAAAKPAAAKPVAAKPVAAKPAAAKPAAAKPAAAKPAAAKPVAAKPATNNRDVNINIDNSKDIHINNSRNTVVRHNSRPYVRPPYVYGGFRFRCYHPYHFHPFHPFVWGPRWHPWGFFITTLAVTAILISVDNIEPQFDLDVAMVSPYSGNNALYAIDPNIHGPFFAAYNNSPGDYYGAGETTTADEYYYDEGVFYLKGDGGYTVVSAPLGAKVKTIPSGYETITLDDNTKNYYYGGTFYEKTSSGYKVVAPVAGSVVTNVSEGGEEVKMGDVTYVKLGETYFQPIQLDGKDVYEVVDVEEDK